MDPEVLFEEVSPNGNTFVMLECDDRVCYMYLAGTKEIDFKLRALWVRNIVPAPEQLDVESVRNGMPPILPAANCKHPDGLSAPDPDKLRCIWLPEGNGVALLEGDEILAIIPPWSGEDGFDGYARDCIGESPVAWELAEDNMMVHRFSDAADYWSSWDKGLWEATQDALISALESALDEHTNYYAIDGGIWPPKAMLRFRSDSYQVLATIGVSLRPQPNVQRYIEDASSLRRMELAVALPADASEETVNRMGSYISAQSGYPWTRYTWLGSGHTIPCDSWPNDKYTFAALTDQSPIGKDASFPKVCGDSVNQLWMIPITDAEQQFAEENLTEDLLAKLPADRWMASS